MIKSVSIVYRNPALSPEEFRDYWENVHTDLIKKSLPGMILYKGSFPIEGSRSDQPTGSFSCDAIVEIGFPDRETMNRAFESGSFASDEREASSARLVDLERTVSMLFEEVDIDLD